VVRFSPTVESPFGEVGCVELPLALRREEKKDDKKKKK
jgi:hypothetical protein